MAKQEELQDAQLAIIQPIITSPTIRNDGKGRPRVPDRPIITGILWILRTGISWSDMPDRFSPYQTSHRRFQEWVRAGVFRQILETLAHDLEKRVKCKLAECFINATFVVAKKEAPELEKPSGARVQRSWQLQTALVYLSPSTRLLLAQMKSPFSKTLTPNASLAPHLKESLGILRMTVTPSIKDLLDGE